MMRVVFKKIFLIFFSVILIILVFEACLRGYKQWLTYSHTREYESNKANEVVILTLGESTTAPITNDTGEDYSWPVYLEKYLNSKTNLGASFKVINGGIDGTRSTYILHGLEENLEKYQPDLIVSMIGINDFLKTINGDKDYVLALSLNQEQGLAEHFYSYRMIKFAIEKIKHRWSDFLSLVVEEDKAFCQSETECLNQAKQESTITNLHQANQLYLSVLEYNPTNDIALRNVLNYYLEQQQFEELEKYFKLLSENHQNDSKNLITLGFAARAIGKSWEASSYFQQALKINSQNSRAYAGLIYLLPLSPRNDLDRKKFTQIVEAVTKNQINSIEVLDALAQCSQAYGYDKDIFYRENLEVSPQDAYGCLSAARYYVHYQKWEKAKDYYLLVLKDPNIGSIALIELYELYHNLGKDEILEEVLVEILEAEDQYVYNYQRLYKRLKAQKIPLIVVQYPMRSIRPLEYIFQGESNVRLVDNEESFKRLVEAKGYGEVFVDSFAGDFGHCTELGNQLLATNIMKVIVSNWQDLELKKSN